MRKSTLSLFTLFSLSLFVFSFYFMPSTKAVGGTSVGWHISEDTTWTLEGSPYIVVEDVIVESDVFLTIKPGVIVKFTSGTNLVVDGSLIAQGNSTHKITFTSNATTPGVGDWETIKLRGQANMSYATIHYAESGISLVQTGSLVDCWSDHLFISSNIYGITIEAPKCALFNLYLDSVEVVNNTNAGIYFGELASPSINSTHIRNSVLSQNGIGISTWVYGSRTLIIMNSIISYNENGGIKIGGTLSFPSIHFSNLIDNGPYDISTVVNTPYVDATFNWWGTTNETLIKERIYDRTREGVSYVPFLNSSKATLTIFTSGVSPDELVWVTKDGTKVDLVNDEKPLNITFYSGYTTQPKMGRFSLGIDNVRIWDSNPNAKYKFVNWTGPTGSGTNNSVTLTITADNSITALYKTQYLVNFALKDNSGTATLYADPVQVQATAPNGTLVTFTSYSDQWLDDGTWILKQVMWQNNNVKPSVDPTYAPTPGGTWAINCRVYLISFTDSFKDSVGNDLYTLPSSFKLTFPNGTTSAPLNPNLGYYTQNGTTTWSTIIWQGTEVVPEDATFDATNGNPTVNCRAYSLTVDPIFYANTGDALVQPSSWSNRFPNGTTRTVSSSVICNQTQAGNYSIVSIIWKATEVVPDITPTISLTSDELWSPNINCLLPTSISISLSTSTSYFGFKVEIRGDLTCNEVSLSRVPILLSYSITGGDSWNDITLVKTTSHGGYSAIWMPSATGNYLIRATWSGNATYPATTTTIHLAVLLFEEQTVFSVESNSTISGLAFNTTNWQLSFTTTGPDGTKGCTRVTVAKSLVANITNIRVYLDGNQSQYSITSTDDSWLLTFAYTHSTHQVVVDLDIIPEPSSSGTTPPGPFPMWIVAGIVITAVVGAALLVYFTKVKKTT